MHFLILLTYFIVVASAIALLTKSTIGRSLSTTIFAVILILYISAIIGSLKIGLILCGVLFIISFILLLIGLSKNFKKNIKYILTPSFCLFVCFFFISWQLSGARLLSTWDEFSHWGLTVKNMFYLNVLGSSSEATTHFKGYPPGSALFLYFWNKLYGTFLEGNLFRATNLLNFALIMPMIHIQKKNRSIKSYATQIIIMMILPVTFYANFYSNIYVDATLGLLFAYILYTYFTNERQEFFVNLNICLALAVLVLMKASGMGLAIIAFLIILIDYLLFKKNVELIKRLKFLLPLILTIILTNQSWKTYLKLTDSKVAWDTSSVTLTNLWRFFRGVGMPYQYETYKNFLDTIFNKEFLPSFFNMTVFFWLLLSILLSVYILRLAKGRKEYYRLKLGLIGVQIGSLIYGSSLLVLYLFTYSAYEAVKLASIERYLNTYLVGLFVFLIGILLYYFDQTMEYKKQKKYLTYTVITLLLFTNVQAFTSYFTTDSIKKREVVEMRSSFSGVEAAKAEIKNKESKMFFISQNTNGYDYWVSRFTFTPLTIMLDQQWSLGEPYDENDIWSINLTVEEWAATLFNNYDYVYIFKCDDLFNKKYGTLFNNNLVENNTLYKVNKENKLVQLKKIQSY